MMPIMKLGKRSGTIIDDWTGNLPRIQDAERVKRGAVGLVVPPDDSVDAPTYSGRVYSGWGHLDGPDENTILRTQFKKPKR